MGSRALKDMLVSGVELDGFCVNCTYCWCSNWGCFAREIDSRVCWEEEGTETDMFDGERETKINNGVIVLDTRPKDSN